MTNPQSVFKMNPSARPIPGQRILLRLAAALCGFGLFTACRTAHSPAPLDRWHDGERTLRTSSPAVRAGETLLSEGDYRNFRLTGEALTQPGAEAALRFHTDGESGYDVLFRNGAIDGTRKSGSLASVRNLYRSLAEDGEWFRFEIAVRGNNIVVRIDSTEVVCYTEPGQPYRTEAHARQRLGHGAFALRGLQGEGRRWTATFSQEALGVFDYLFTDAMTIIDHKGRNARIYRPEEVHYDGVTREQYMDRLVSQTELILTNEPADIYANPTYLPEDMQPDYDRYWSDERVDRVLDVLQRYDIALEINARYRIPSFDIIRRARERGIRFTFGTNNVDADFGRLEYCLEAVERCGLTADDMWFPSMSVRRKRPVVLYNRFD